MRVVQIIDSLEAGGAERMAVNYANALQEKFGFSALVSTRKEGLLKEQMDSRVPYLHLKKKRTFDLGAVLRLKKFIKKHKIEVLHAHSSSYFIAVMVWMLSKKLKIVWHDHYGNSEFLSQRKVGALRFFSNFFTAIISVNSNLEQWSKDHLKCRKVLYLPNFVLFANSTEAKVRLKRNSGKKILLLANLRAQKNHLLLLKIAVIIKTRFPDWTFHLVGKDFADSYSETIKKEIENNDLTETVFIYGSQEAVSEIIEQCDIGILTSDSEGLPVALLEYGYCGLPVVTTDVGEISSVIKNNSNGFLAPPQDAVSFSEKLMVLIESEDTRTKFAANLQKTIFENYTQDAVITKYQNYIEGII